MIDDGETQGLHSALRTPANQKSKIRNQKFPSGLTLIELLITVAIIATLSALFLGASRSAMESARAARTKTTILKIHTLLMEQWASYETRRVDIDQEILSEINNLNTNVRGDVLADMRLIALRELMKYEMPDRWSDVDLQVNPLNKTSLRDQSTVVLASVPTVARTYYRRFNQALINSGNDIGKIRTHQAAECLYQTVMLMTGDGEARSLFSPQDIGDTDGDGLPEFLDGWGNPIAWSRWPAGFVARSSLMTGDTVADHDPFDPFGRHLSTALPIPSAYTGTYLGQLQPYIQRLRHNVPVGGFFSGYRLMPLIYSSGSDGISDINTSRQLSVTHRDDGIFLDPYATGSDNLQFGLPGDDADDGDDNSIDNIHNHLQEGR